MNIDSQKKVTRGHTVISRFAELFEGRADCFAIQQDTGQYYRTDQVVWDEVVQAHLAGITTFGVYPIDRANKVGFLVLDVDVPDAHPIERLIEASKSLGIEEGKILLEFSGNKGFHLWYFFEERLPAFNARGVGLAIAEEAGESLPPIEIFPKQTQVSGNGFGSLIKLPLGIHRKSGQHSFFLRYPEMSHVAPEEALASVRKIEVEIVEGILEQNPPPQESAKTDVASPKGLPCLRRMLIRGVKEGCRDEVAFRIAVHLYKQGLPFDQAFLLLNDWNQKNRPPLDDRTIEQKAHSAYKGYGSYGCENPLISQFCDSTCPIKRNQQTNKAVTSQSTASSGSKLITLEKVESTYTGWLYLPTIKPVRFSLAVTVANRFSDADPVWAFLIGPPGHTKTVIIASLNGVTGVYPLSSLTAQTFASGWRGKDVSLLTKLAEIDQPILTLKDFGTILTMHRETRQEVLAQLREIYDGTFTKEWGTGKRLEWEGKIGFLAGATPAIDTHHSIYQVLGERFIQYRIEQADSLTLAKKSMSNQGRTKQMYDELKGVVASFVNNLNIPKLAEIDLGEEVLDKIAHLASFAVRARSGVIRDPYHRDEVLLIPDPEVPTRLAKQLSTLGAAFMVMRGSSELSSDDYELLYEIGLDCIPIVRRKALELLTEAEAEVTTSDVGVRLDYPTSTIRRTLQDLAGVGILKRTSEGHGKADTWLITQEAREWLKIAKPDGGDDSW